MLFLSMTTIVAESSPTFCVSRRRRGRRRRCGRRCRSIGSSIRSSDPCICSQQYKQ